MKKYIRPIAEIFENCSMDHLMEVSNPKGDAYGRWGNGDPNEPYGNEDWVNEGYGDDIVIGGDDDGEIDSRGKAWGDLWF